MPESPKIQAPIGGLDKELDLPFVSDKDYIDAKNIRHISKDGQSSVSAENIYGAEFVWKAYIDGNAIQAQNKQVRIAVNATGADPVNATVTFYTSPNGVAYTPGGTFNIPNGLSPQALDNLVAYLDATWVAFGYGNVVEIDREITNLNFASVVVELGVNGTYTGIDFEVEFDITAVGVSEIVEEAIPVTYAGEAHCIGSADLLGTSISFWTTQRNLPDTRDVIGATNAIPIVITESEAHGLVDGDEVIIQGVQFNTDANGKWIVNVLSPTTYELVGSDGNATPTVAISAITAELGTGYAVIFTSSPHGMAVGNRVFIEGVTGTTTANGLHTVVSVYNATTFVIDVVAVGGYIAGGTVFRVSGSIHDSLGYGMIWVAEKNPVDNTWTATRLLASKELNFVTLKQIDCRAEINGGRIEVYFTDDYNSPRVFYYTGAFVQDGGIDRNGNGPGIYVYGDIDEALLLFLTAPDVNMDVSQLQAGGSLPSGNGRYLTRYSTDNVNYSLLTEPTGPVNVFSENIGVPTGIRGDAEQTITPKVNVISVTGIPSYFNFVELIWVHYTGGGVESFSIRRQALDGTGNATLYHYGNETTIANFDNAELFQQRPDIKTALNIENLDQRLELSNTTAYEYPDLTDWAQAATHIAFRETLDNLGSNNPRVGYGGEPLYGEYQDYDNVESRVGYMINETYRFGVRLRFRGSDVYTPPYWVDDVTFTTGASGRRTAGLTNFSLTTLPIPTNPPSNATSAYPFVFYPIFTGFDFGFVLPNGKTIATEFDQIEFVRAERNPTVLAAGMAMLAIDNAGTFETDPACLNTVAAQGFYLTPTAPYAGAGTERQYLYLMFPDTFLGEDIDFVAGDQIANFGNPTYQILRKTAALGVTARTDALEADLYGDASTNSQTVGIDALVFNAGTVPFTINGNQYDPAANSAFNYPSYYAAVDAALTDQNGVLDEGIYYVQYVRPNANQYGDTAATFYYTTKASFDIDSDSSAADTFAVLGGDVFTQKTTWEQFYTDASNRWGQAVAFYSQNTVNSQMRQMGNDASNEIVLPRGNDPNDDWDTRITETGDYRNRELRAYDPGYNAAYLLQQFAGFNPNVSQNADFPTRIWWSVSRGANSLLDNYRIFLPLQYKDLPTANGEILAMLVLNGELYTWQQRAFMRQYFNARATLNGGDDVPEILIGTTTVLSQDGIVISTRGTKHKWSVIKGRSVPGADTVYWANSELKNMMKFAADGTDTVSESKKMKAFFANNLRWADQFTTPADYFGIHGVWSERYAEVIWTIRGNATPFLDEWDVATNYSIGNAVKWADTPLYLQNFEQTGEIYVYISTTPNLHDEPSNDTVWEKISHDDPRYYNEYTIAYCEARDTWESFRSHKPRIYLRWTDGYLSPRPLSNTGFVYEHDRDYICRWYEQTGEFILTGAVTKAAGSLTVTGVGSAFTTELQNGFELLPSGGSSAPRYVVREIISDTVLILDDAYIVNYGQYNAAVEKTVADQSTVTFTLYYPCQIEDAYIEPVVNEFGNVNKRYVAQQYVTEVVPFRTEYRTKTTESYLLEEDFTEREDGYYAPIKNDSTDTGDNDGDTGKIRGYWMKNKFFMRFLIYQKFYDFCTKQVLQPRMFNR